MYVRLNIIVEGQTEETFVNQILTPHLSRFSIGVSARVFTAKKMRGTRYRGGYESPVCTALTGQPWNGVTAAFQSMNKLDVAEYEKSHSK